MTEPNRDGRRIVIEPVTRVEGHGKVTILLDGDGHVRAARLHIVEFRGFERFIVGRPYWELPVIVQRLCGICPVSHHLCAAKATDRIVGADRLTETAQAIRRLMHYGQILQSHALHFFHLASPDLLFGFEAPLEQRHFFAVAEERPDLARRGILMRKYGQEVIRLTAGKRIHGTGAIPGGVNRSLTAEERTGLRADADEMVEWARDALALAREITIGKLEELSGFAAFPSHHLALVRADGALELYDGGLRAIDPEGRIIFDHFAGDRYREVLAEEVRPWSYMKFPFLTGVGPEDGWYRVGPLARVNACDFIDTPHAEEARREFVALGDGRPVGLSLAYHWARMIELVHVAEKIRDVLDGADLTGTDLVVAGGERRSAGIGVLEAPRGTLFHDFEVGDDDLVTRANLIVSTTGNNEAMNRAVADTARRYLDGVEITEGLLNRVEAAIRAYDPCLSCATHAVGRMPLVVDLVDAAGATLDRKVRE